MSVPDWYALILLALAAWRVFQLICCDEILDRPRRYVTGRLSERWELFIECPYCAGFWIAVIWWAAWQIESKWTLIVAVPWALSAGVIAASKVLSSD